jgi:hypothetical protein
VTQWQWLGLHLEPSRCGFCAGCAVLAHRRVMIWRATSDLSLMSRESAACVTVPLLERGALPKFSTSLLYMCQCGSWLIRAGFLHSCKRFLYAKQPELPGLRCFYNMKRAASRHYGEAKQDWVSTRRDNEATTGAARY